MRTAKRKKTPKRRPKPTGIPTRQLRIEYVPIGKLKPWKDNPRHNDDAAERLGGLFEAHGFINPIIATRDGTIRAGHTRYKAAKKKGMKEVPVIYVDFDSEEDAELFSIAENRSHEWSEWDQDKLQEVFGELLQTLPDRAPQSAGFSQIEIEGLVSQPQEPADFQEAVERFSREASQDGMEDEWAWFMTPDKETLEVLVEKYGKAGAKGTKKRELDWEKIRRGLMVPVRRKRA